MAAILRRLTRWARRRIAVLQPQELGAVASGFFRIRAWQGGVLGPATAYKTVAVGWSRLCCCALIGVRFDDAQDI